MSRTPPALPLPLFFLIFLVFVTASACGSGARYQIDQASWRHRQQRQSATPPPAMLAMEEASVRTQPYTPAPPAPIAVSTDRAEHPFKKISSSKHRSFGKAASRIQLRSDVKKGTRDKPKVAQTDGPAMVVYLGYLKLRVRRRLPSIDRITALANKAGGYIERLGKRVVIVRIPAVDFEAVMSRFADLGEVLDRRVKALDVSRQFTDLSARLGVATQARARLMRLLELERDVEERLRILGEIKRLSEVIEGIESKRSTLRNLADYFTITIELEVIEGRRWQPTHRSPFPWVRSLAAHRVTLHGGTGLVQMQMPRGFVLFDEDDDYRAQAADTSMLRAGRVDNEPRGDAAWWAQAVTHELQGRDEEVVAQGARGSMVFRVFRNKDVRPRYWLIGLLTRGEDLYVLEVFFPRQEAWDRHHTAVMESLHTFEIK